MMLRPPHFKTLCTALQSVKQRELRFADRVCFIQNKYHFRSVALSISFSTQESSASSKCRASHYLGAIILDVPFHSPPRAFVLVCVHSYLYYSLPPPHCFIPSFFLFLHITFTPFQPCATSMSPHQQHDASPPCTHPLSHPETLNYYPYFRHHA
jgi:hypothetical protein